MAERPWHPATVMQRSAHGPHAATVVGAGTRRPPHPATVVQRSLRPPHAATVQAAARPPHAAQGFGQDGRHAPHPASASPPRVWAGDVLQRAESSHTGGYAVPVESTGMNAWARCISVDASGNSTSRDTDVFYSGLDRGGMETGYTTSAYYQHAWVGSKYDSEVKLLHHIERNIGGYFPASTVSGELQVYGNGGPCDSCKELFKRTFRAAHPTIALKFTYILQGPGEHSAGFNGWREDEKQGHYYCHEIDARTPAPGTVKASPAQEAFDAEVKQLKEMLNGKSQMQKDQAWKNLCKKYAGKKVTIPATNQL